MRGHDRLIAHLQPSQQSIRPTRRLVLETPSHGDRCVGNETRHLVFVPFVDHVLDLETPEPHSFTQLQDVCHRFNGRFL